MPYAIGNYILKPGMNLMSYSILPLPIYIFNLPRIHVHHFDYHAQMRYQSGLITTTGDYSMMCVLSLFTTFEHQGVFPFQNNPLFYLIPELFFFVKHVSLNKLTNSSLNKLTFRQNLRIWGNCNRILEFYTSPQHPCVAYFPTFAIQINLPVGVYTIHGTYG